VGVTSIFSALALILAIFVSFTVFTGPSNAAPEIPKISQANDWTNSSTGLPIFSGPYYNTVFGDFNNDGKLDVACTRGHAFIGDGNGNWVEQSNGLPLNGWEFDMEVGDLDNDGNLDLIAGGRIFTGDGGAGGSMTWTEQNLLGVWNGVAVGDVNNDGKLDVVYTTGGINVRTSDGIPPFTWTDSSGTLPSTSNFWGVKLGDINNDGKLDIVATNNSGGIYAWTGNGGTGASAVWTDATGTGLPSTGLYTGVFLGDVNHDGKLDILAGIQNNVARVFTGNGGVGGFVWTDNSTGLGTGGNHYQVVLGDVNRDGNLDVVGASYGGGINVWEGNGGQGGSMVWTSAQYGLPTSELYVDVSLGDANNDGKLDIVASGDLGVRVWLNNYPDFIINGYSSISMGLPTTDKWYDIVFGDINNDGKLDLAASSASPSSIGVRVWTGDGTGIWTDASTGLPLTGNYNGLRFADVNHDGKLDLVGSMNGGGGAAVTVFYGDGTGSWTETSVPSSTPIGCGVEVLDVNHDGNDDIITCNYINGENVYVYLGDGTGGWGLNSGPSETNGYDDVALGDVDHDGNLDLISTSMINSVETRFWLGDGSGSNWILQTPGIPTTGVYLGAALADVNHDSDLDAGLAGYAGGALMMKVYTSDGGAGGSVDWTDESTGLPIGSQYAGIEFGDLNLDGNVDMIYSNQNGGIEVSTGNGGAGGSMSWTDAWFPNLPTTGNYWGIALGDVNNDGKLEIGATKNSGIEVWKIDFVSSLNQPPELLGGQVVPTLDNEGETFIYNVTYRDADNEPPTPVPYVWINKSGSPYGSSPYPMVPQNWVGTPGNYSQGRNYNFSLAITDCGDDFTFLFNASDGTEDEFTSEFPEPTVNCFPEAQALSVQGYSPGSAGINHITDHAPDLSWTFFDEDMDTQILYEVRVGTAPGLADMWAPGIQGGAITTVTYAGAVLVDGTDYWFGIWVYDGLGWSAWNETQFLMNSLPPTAITPIDPADDSNIPASPGQFLSWTSGGADAEGDTVTHYWYVDTDNPPVTPYVANDFTTGTSSTSFATLPSTDYYWYVNTTDSWEWNSTIVWNFTTSTIVNNLPEAQDLTVQGFSQGTAGIMNLTDHTPDLAWTYYDVDTDPQTQFEVRIGTAPGLADMWTSGVQVGASTSINYAGLPLIDGAGYWFGVRVHDGMGWSSWNETGFHMNALVPPPTLVSPLDGSIGLQPGTQTINWNVVADPEGSPVTYYWYVSTVPTFSSIYDSGTTTSISTTFSTAEASTYYWRVRANDSYELSTNSTTWNFTTNRPPILDWTGETSYTNDGVNPESGDSATDFEFRIKYTDIDNQTGTLRLVVVSDGSEYVNQTMNEVDTSDLDATDGKLYTITRQLGEDSYSYYFYAVDTMSAWTTSVQRSLTVSSELGRIIGSVITEDDLPIENAKVELEIGGLVVGTEYTDSQGEFEFSDLEFGNYNIRVSMDGYYEEVVQADLDQSLRDLDPIILEKIEQPSESFWWLVIPILAIIIVIILLILLLLRRKKKKEEAELPREADYLTMDSSSKET